MEQHRPQEEALRCLERLRRHRVAPRFQADSVALNSVSLRKLAEDLLSVKLRNSEEPALSLELLQQAD